MIDRKIRSGTKKVDEYIELLEEELSRRSMDGVEKLIKAINAFSLALSKDMQKLAEGTGEGIVILSNNKDDKEFDRAMKVVDSIEKFNKVKLLAEDLDKLFLMEEKNAEAAEGSAESFVFLKEKSKRKKNVNS